MTWAPLALQAVGAAMTAYSAFSKSSNDKAAYKYQAGVDRNNAMIAEWNAQDIERRGRQELIDLRRRNAALKGTQIATLASRGIDLSEGSALNILADTEYLGEQDELTLKTNTKKQAWGARVEGSNHTANSILLQSRSDQENPLLSGATSLLTDAGKVASGWYTYKKGKAA